jgi:hypothetical protein
VSTIKLGAWPVEVGRDVAGVDRALFSTVKGSPHEDVCAVERPIRDRNVVFRRLDVRILGVLKLVRV